MNSEEILKKCTENALGCKVVYNMCHHAIIQAMEEYANQFTEQKQSEIDELVEFIKDAWYNNSTDVLSARLLIQKHTKK